MVDFYVFVLNFKTLKYARLVKWLFQVLKFLNLTKKKKIQLKFNFEVRKKTTFYGNTISVK